MKIIISLAFVESGSVIDIWIWFFFFFFFLELVRQQQLCQGSDGDDKKSGELRRRRKRRSRVLNVVGDQRDVKITRQLHLDYLPTTTIPSALLLSLSLSTKLIFKGEQKMNSDRLKGPLENSPTTPQPSPAISCLFFFSSLQINYFVRGEKRRKRELAGGPPFVCAHRESQARRFISGCWLHSSFFWSFSPFFIIIISSVFNRRRRRSFSFF